MIPLLSSRNLNFLKSNQTETILQELEEISRMIITEKRCTEILNNAQELQKWIMKKL